MDKVEAEENRRRLNLAANDAFFTNMKVPELRKFVKKRDIQISVNCKSRRRAELLELYKDAAEIKVPKLKKRNSATRRVD